MKPAFHLLFLASLSAAAPLPILNPSVEINDGVDGTPVSDASVMGWDGTGRLSDGNTGFGNGRWKLGLGASESVYQLTDHLVETGAAYSIRFDAALTTDTGEVPDSLLIGGARLNGDFNEDQSTEDIRSFAQTPSWTNLGGAESFECTRTNILFDGTRCAVLRQNGGNTPIFGNDTGYLLEAGDVISVSFLWRDAFNWNDGADRVEVFLFTTEDDDIDSEREVIQSLNTPTSSQNNTFEPYANDFDPIPASAAGKRLFVGFTSVDGNNDDQGYGRVENFRISVNESDPTTTTGRLIVEAIAEDDGALDVIASRSIEVDATGRIDWEHHHLAIPAGTADSFAGKKIGVRLRAPDHGDELARFVDNVRMDYYPASLDDGAFADDWNLSADRVWIGPGYWANRLQDWEVSAGRVNCTFAGKPRRTVHRVGTSIRGNGGDFTLMARTGVNTGSLGSGARTGFLIGAGPNLDWRGALLVHDGLGRDFGTFLGIDHNGAAIIDDMSRGEVTRVDSGANPAGGFPSNARLKLVASYDASKGEYELEIQALGSTGNILSQASIGVPSDRVLGSFGLMSHRASNTTFWFDDFTGTGDALQPEPDRHLAIIGALHTLNRGELRMSAHLSPVDIATTPDLTLEVLEDDAWKPIATASIDNTDDLSSYTAAFVVDSWDDSRDTPYRIRIAVDGQTYGFEGVVRKDPVEKNEIVVINSSCQRAADGSVESDSIDWTPSKIWHPHGLAYRHIEKHEADVYLALGDQIYEGQPTSKDTSSHFNRHHDYLYKWYLWVLQGRDISRKLPTIAIPDDHDIYQGNLWGEGGIFTTDQTTGGYEQPASWVRMVERTHASHLPTPDPYNPIQPAPPVAQGIGVYFTGLCYGEIGFAVLEDRKFKTGRQDAPSDPSQLVLLGERQKDFLKAWSTDWSGQQIKCVVSQTPMGMIHTHASANYGFFLNDRDSNGWPSNRREEAWDILRRSRSFQLAGDQHIATVVHHGIDGPADAGYSFTSPAISNFFPRVWDPEHNSGGRTSTVSPYKGDFFLNGVGDLPTGSPNLNSDIPGHIRVEAAGNPLEYYNQTRGIEPRNLHDRGAGYGIVRIDKTTRRIVFEAWPLHSDPEFPQTGSQFPDWPVSLNQTDNDGRLPTGFLPVIETLSEKDPVVSVYDEATGELVYSMRFPGSVVRPPVYDNGRTYRVEISYADEPVSEVLEDQVASLASEPGIDSFIALEPSIVAGDETVLQWSTRSPTTLTVDQGVGSVIDQTIHGIGHVRVAPTSDTTYALTLDGGAIAEATVLVVPGQSDWLELHFTPAEREDPEISGDEADPDKDGFTNEEEYRFQTDPRSAAERPELISGIVEAEGQITVDFSSPFPLDSQSCTLRVEVSESLEAWDTLPSGSYRETGRSHTAESGTIRVSVRLEEPALENGKRFYRAVWELE